MFFLDLPKMEARNSGALGLEGRRTRHIIVKEREVPIVANAMTPRRLGPAGDFPWSPPRAGMRSQAEKGTKSGVSQVILLKGKGKGKRKTKGKGKKGKE